MASFVCTYSSVQETQVGQIFMITSTMPLVNHTYLDNNLVLNKSIHSTHECMLMVLHFMVLDNLLVEFDLVLGCICSIVL